jgi:hypothetical protein
VSVSFGAARMHIDRIRSKSSRGLMVDAEGSSGETDASREISASFGGPKRRLSPGVPRASLWTRPRDSEAYGGADQAPRGKPGVSTDT